MGSNCTTKDEKSDFQRRLEAFNATELRSHRGMISALSLEIARPSMLRRQGASQTQNRQTSEQQGPTSDENGTRPN